MADMRAEVQAHLDQFKSAIDEARQQVDDLEALMETVDNAFTAFLDEFRSETQEMVKILSSVQSHNNQVDALVKQQVQTLLNTLENDSARISEQIGHIETIVQESSDASDNFRETLEESDKAANKAMEEILEKASSTADKSEATIDEIKDSGEKSADKFDDEVVQHLDSANAAITETYDTFRATAENKRQALEQHASDFAERVTDQAQSFADQASALGEHTRNSAKESMDKLSQGFGGQMEELANNIETFQKTFEQISDTVSTLTTGAVETVDTIGDAMNTVNVGLNGVVETVTHVKEILDQIRL